MHKIKGAVYLSLLPPNITCGSQKPVLVEEIGSGATSEMDKGPLLATANTTSSVIKDNTSSVPKVFAGKSMTVNSAEDTSTMVKAASSTVEELSTEIKDNCSTVKDESSAARDQKEDTPEISSTSQPQLPPVPTSSIAFIHDWKRLRAHEDLKSNYFQVLISSNTL